MQYLPRGLLNLFTCMKFENVNNEAYGLIFIKFLEQLDNIDARLVLV